MRTALAIPIAFGAALGAASTSAPLASGDTDLYWHLASASETLASGLVRTDVFSWTVRGDPVGTDQWLGQLLLYAGYSAAEWTGVMAVRALAVALLVGLIVATAMLRRPGRPLVAAIAAFPGLLLSRFVWTERPELFGFVCFAALVLLFQLRSRLALFLVAPLLVLWANLHGSFALGAVLTLAVSAYGLRSDRERSTGYAIAALGALASLVATPAGLATLTAPGIHLFDPPRQIQEWIVPDPLTLAGALWALTLGLVLATAVLAPPARALDVLLIVPVAALSFTASRQMPLLAVVAAPYLADRGPEAWAALRTRLALDLRLPPMPPARELPRRVDAIAAAIGLAVVLGAAALGPSAPDDTGRPLSALPLLPGGPGLLAHYDWGGWLIWRAPDTPVFIDGRLIPYRRGDPSVLDDYVRVVEARPGWQDVVERRGIKWILVRPADPIAVRGIDLGWRTLSASRDHILMELSAE